MTGKIAKPDALRQVYNHEAHNLQDRIRKRSQRERSYTRRMRVVRSAYSIVHFCVDPGKRLHGERVNKDHWFILEQGAVLCTQHRKERPMTPSEWLAQHEWQPSPIPIADEQGNIISGCLIHAIAFAIPSVDEQADAIEALNRYCLQKYPHLKQVVQSAYVINYVDKTMLATKADAVALLRDAGL